MLTVMRFGIKNLLLQSILVMVIFMARSRLIGVRFRVWG